MVHDHKPSQIAVRTMGRMNERTTTRSDYAVRLERVFRWLADHLDDTLDLARLADVGCMSPYHFHRIYHATQGETSADTVRLRLHRAAVELITGALPVPRIARRAEYGSQEAFTRAFKAAYGVPPPARYRASFVPMPTTDRAEDAMETTVSYQATIRDTPPIRVAALAHRGDYLKIGSTFERSLTARRAAGSRVHHAP